MRRDNTEFKKNKRILLYGKYPEKTKCHECFSLGNSWWAIEIHHKDGDHNNNKMENLIPLCRLCHMKKHYPTIRRLIPYGGGSYRKNKNILEMVKKDYLDENDFEFLSSVKWGKIFIDSWFK